MSKELQEVVRRWMVKAERDLRSARNDLKDKPPITDVAAYHCQQCVEKCLKAVLASRLKHIHKSHYLPYLLEECLEVEPEISIFKETAELLYVYAITSRYPDDWRDISIEEAREAMKRASEVYLFVTKRLNESGFATSDDDVSLDSVRKGRLTKVEKDTIRTVMEESNGNVALAARRLGIARGTLYKKLEEHGLK